MARLLKRIYANTFPCSSSPSSLLKTLTLTLTHSIQNLSPNPNPNPSSSSRSFLSLSTPAAFDENLLRILRSEIAYFSEHGPPYKPITRFKSFTIEDKPGEQWIRLQSTQNSENIKIDVTMFDGLSVVGPITGGDDPSLFEKVESMERGPRLHISLLVEILSSGGDKGCCPVACGFICSAWPDSLTVQKVFPLRQGGPAVRPYNGRKFKNLEGVRKSVREYLEKRGIDDELAEFLHKYISNKDKMELLRWLKNIQSYIEK